MPLKINSIKYYTPDSGTAQNKLKANLQDTVQAVINFTIERSAFFSDDNRVIFKPYPYMIDTVDNNNVIYTPDDECFLECTIGDTLYFRNVQGASIGDIYVYNIVNKINNQTVKVEPSTSTPSIYFQEIGNPSSESTRASFGVVDLLSTLDLYFNLAAKGEEGGYVSKIDGESILMRKTNLYHTVILTPPSLTFVGNKSHHQGKALARGVEIINFVYYNFDLELSFRVFNYTTEDLLLNIINGTQQINTNYEILAKLENYNDSTLLISDSLSDTTLEIGNYNVNFQSTTRYYELLNKAYTVGGQVKESLALNQPTTVTLRYKRNGGTITANKLEVTFMVANESYAAVNDVNKTYEQAIGFNYARTTSTTILDQTVPDLSYRVFSGVITTTAIDASTFDITFTVDFGSTILDLLVKADNKYMLFVTEYTDTRERTLVDYNTAVKVLPILNLFTNDLTVFAYDPTSGSELKDPEWVSNDFSLYNTQYYDVVPEVYMTDILEGNNIFIYPKTETILFNTIKCSVVAKKTTGEEIIFEENEVNLTQYPIDNGGQRIVTLRNQLSVNQTYKNVIYVQTIASSTTHFQYALTYNFTIGNRSDKYLPIQEVPNDFFVSGQTRLTSDYLKYDQATDWNTFYKVTLGFIKDGDEYEQTFYNRFILHPYSSTDWGTHTIRLYDKSTNVELTSGANTYIQGEVKVVATFTKATLPNLIDLSASFFLEKTGEDGVRESFTYTNNVSLVTRGTITIESGNVVVTGFIDAELIKKDCRLYCRLFEATDGGTPTPTNYLLAENGNYITQENGNYIEIDV